MFVWLFVCFVYLFVCLFVCLVNASSLKCTNNISALYRETISNAGPFRWAAGRDFGRGRGGGGGGNLCGKHKRYGGRKSDVKKEEMTLLLVPFFLPSPPPSTPSPFSRSRSACYADWGEGRFRVHLFSGYLFSSTKFCFLRKGACQMTNLHTFIGPVAVAGLKY